MTTKAFATVFEKISLSEAVKKAFCNSVVENVIVHKKQKNLEVHLVSEEILGYTILQQLQNELLNQIPGVKGVNISPFFNVKEKFSEKEIIEKYWENVVCEISSQSPICKGIMKEAYWELQQKKLLIYVKNNTAYYMYKKGMEEKIQQCLQQQTALQFRVMFKDVHISEQEKEEFSQRQISKQNEMIAQISAKQAEVEKIRDTQQTEAVSESIMKGVLFGKEFNGAVSKIYDSKIEGEKVIIEGNLFHI